MNKCGTNLNVPEALRLVLGTVNCVFGLAALLGNMMMFVIVYKNRHLQTRSFACLLSLAMTDFLVGLILEPMHAMQFFVAKFRNNCIFNTVRRFLSTFLLCTSILCIAVISYDRYIHLSKTVRYQDHMTKRKILVLIAICWIIPACLPFLRFGGEYIYSTAIVLVIVAVFTIVVTCYLVIIRMVKRSTMTKVQGREMRQHLKVAKAIAIIIVCFGILFIPMAVYMMLAAIAGFPSVSFTGFSADVKEIFYAFSITLVLSNSALNPIIYYFRIPDIRNNLKRILFKIGLVTSVNESEFSDQNPKVTKETSLQERI